MINLVVALVLTLVFNAVKLSPGGDHTVWEDYKVDAGDEGVEELDVDDLSTDTPTR